MIAMQEKKWDEASVLRQVMKLNAGAYPLVYFFSAAANYNQQNLTPPNKVQENSRPWTRSTPSRRLSLVELRAFAQAGLCRRRPRNTRLPCRSPNSPEAGSLAAEAKRFEDLSVSAKRE